MMARFEDQDRELRATQVKLEGRSHLLGQALETSQDLVSIADLDDRFTYVNRAFLDAYGYEEREILGRGVGPRRFPEQSTGPAREGLRGDGGRGLARRAAEPPQGRPRVSHHPQHLPRARRVGTSGRLPGRRPRYRRAAGRRGAGPSPPRRSRGHGGLRGHHRRRRSGRVGKPRVHAAHRIRGRRGGGPPRARRHSESQDEPYPDGFGATLREGKVWKGEIARRRRDGSRYHEELTVTPVRDEGGRVAHYVGIQRDVTERRRLEAQLRQAQKMEAVGRWPEASPTTSTTCSRRSSGTASCCSAS